MLKPVNIFKNNPRKYKTKARQIVGLFYFTSGIFLSILIIFRNTKTFKTQSQPTACETQNFQPDKA